MKSKTTIVLWAVFVAVLLVLLPHTAWAFRQLEPAESPAIIGGFTWADLVSYIAAFAFEAAIAALTHKLAKHIETTKKKTFQARYWNPYAFGLFITTAVSVLANLAHAVQFGQSLLIFTKWSIPPSVYSVAFGGILPLVSLTFARVLSNVTDDEEAANPELEQAKVTIRELHKQVRESEAQRIAAEDRARLAEERFGAMGDLFRRIFGEDKRERIIAVREWKPKLPGSAVALITETSPSYVSEVFSELEEVKQ